MSNHSEVIDHNEEELELALEKNLKLSCGLGSKVLRDFLFSELSCNIRP